MSRMWQRDAARLLADILIR